MKKTGFTVIVVFSVLFGPPAEATSITLDLDVEFSGGQDPAGTPPWLRAVIDDGGSAGSVKITLIALNLVDEEFITGWYFNVEPSFLSLTIANTGGVAGTASAYSQNAYKADGDGKYDLLFSYPSGPPAARFVAGATSEWTITAAGLTASHFNLLSHPDGGHGPFRTAAHVQGIEGGGSGWITESGEIPEPTTLALVAAGVLGMTARRRRNL